MTLIDVIRKFERLEQIAAQDKFTSKADCKYEWELGTDICEMVGGNFRVYIKENDLKNLTLMGYPVRINYENKTIIKLWKEVEA
jgi:hypothetical protein